MKKDFLTIIPDSGGTAQVQVTADQFFNTLGGRFAYGETESTGTAGKNNGVGNYYHSLGFWFKTT